MSYYHYIIDDNRLAHNLIESIFETTRRISYSFHDALFACKEVASTENYLLTLSKGYIQNGKALEEFILEANKYYGGIGAYFPKDLLKKEILLIKSCRVMAIDQTYKDKMNVIFKHFYNLPQTFQLDLKNDYQKVWYILPPGNKSKAYLPLSMRLK